MLEGAGRQVAAVTRGVVPYSRAKQDPETAQVCAFLRAGHPLLAFSVVVMRRLGRCVGVVAALIILG